MRVYSETSSAGTSTGWTYSWLLSALRLVAACQAVFSSVHRAQSGFAVPAEELVRFACCMVLVATATEQLTVQIGAEQPGAI